MLTLMYVESRPRESGLIFRTFPLRNSVSFFHIFYYSLAIILMSASSSTLAVPIREVHTSCMGTPFITVNTKQVFVFRSLVTYSQRLNDALSFLEGNYFVTFGNISKNYK